MKVAVYTSRGAAMQGDLFGKKIRAPRGWTELDKLRRRYALIEKRVKSGDYNSDDLEEFEILKDQIEQRELEAKEKWERSFKK